jgi:hypothetical protein
METIQKALQPSQYLLVCALPQQYQMKLWSLIDEVIPQPEEGSPRAIILCTSDVQAREIHAEFVKLAKTKDLTVDLVVEKGNKLQQRNDLFDGTEIIVGTTRRMAELYFQNGFNIKKLKLLLTSSFFVSYLCCYRHSLSRRNIYSRNSYGRLPCAVIRD